MRALEFDHRERQKHDNELATFVIGLANTTLLNIYGEVPGDMDDILQTSVHAFFRMTQVKYHPSCQFVHQNASLNVKSEVGRANFTKKLNEFTLAAAKEEHCEGKYEFFNDVIEFDEETDVHYFPGLWKGDPPMAPVNKGYSRAAQQLKLQFIELICARARKSDLRLSSFCVKVSDLWKALLNETFIFSFKNTLEITAYNALETAYSKWQWDFCEALSDWEQKEENVIETESAETLSSLEELQTKCLKVYVTKRHDSLKEEMDEFFNGKQSEILIQWKGEFEIRLNNLAKELQQNAMKHCAKLINRKRAIIAFQEDKETQKYAEQIKAEVMKLCENIRQEQESLRESIRNEKNGTRTVKEITRK